MGFTSESIPKNYDRELRQIQNSILDLKNKIENVEIVKEIELERPLKKIGSSYFVQIPMDIARANNFENLKIKFKDKSASALLNSLMKQLENSKKINAHSQT